MGGIEPTEVEPKSTKSNDERPLSFDETSKQSDTTNEAEATETDTAKKTAKRHRFARLSRFKKRLLLGVLGAVVLLIILLLVPVTRWPILNFVGLRGNLQFTVTEDGPQKAISGAQIVLDDGQTAKTDNFGRTHFSRVRLGQRTATIQKAGYGDQKLTVASKLGTTKTNVALKVIGLKLNFDVKDWLSQQPLPGAAVSHAENKATSDATGRVTLVIDPTDEQTIQVTVSAPGYLERKITRELSLPSQEISLVAAQKNYFISKRDGTFDIFSSNLDGGDQRKLIEATGKEDEGLLQFTINRNNRQAILVANRDGKTKNNRLIAGIYLVDLEKATITKLDEGSDVQLLDWNDGSISYIKTVPELTYDDPNLTRLMSLNLDTAKLTQLAQTNYFQVALSAQNKVFYAVADSYRPTANGPLTSYDLKTKAVRTYLPERRIISLSRASYDNLLLQDTVGTNFALAINNGNLQLQDRRPAISLNFSLSPAGKRVLYNDRRDGQGALVVRQLDNQTERLVARVGGLTAPTRFITEDLAIVRMVTSQETADYVVHLPSGKLAKIVDVSNLGFSRSASY